VSRALRLAGLAALAALLAAQTGRAADRPAYGGELRVALPVPPRLSDPALAREPQDLWLTRAQHATPLGFRGEGELGPGLLERVPEPQDGGRAFQLTLREGLRFSDGGPLVKALDASSDFRAPEAARSVRGRSWAIHDGVGDPSLASSWSCGGNLENKETICDGLIAPFQQETEDELQAVGRRNPAACNPNSKVPQRK